MRSIQLLTVFGLCAVSTLALAQTTFGEIAQQGKRLSSAEVREKVVGRSLKGPGPNGRGSTIEVKPDGKYTGSLERSSRIGRANNLGVFGDWTLAENGQFCIASGAASGDAGKACGFFYVLGDKYFVVAAKEGQEPQAESVVLPREIGD